MNFQHSNFYITIVDLFAVLLPGTLAILILIYSKIIILEQVPAFITAKEFIYGFVFLLTSYLAGHIIHQLGSFVDDLFYDPYKNLFFPKITRLDKVKGIRKDSYDDDPEKSKVNTFEWSIFKIQQDKAAVYTDVEKTMAESKFFRGLFVVLVLLLVYLIIENSSNIFFLSSWMILVLVYLVSKIQNWFSKLNKTKNKWKETIDEKIKETPKIKVKKYSTFDLFLQKYLFKVDRKSEEVTKDDKEIIIAQKEIKGRKASWFALGLLLFLISVPIILNWNNLNTKILLVLPFACFSLMRYFSKRHKSTETAYKYIIFSHELNEHKESWDQSNKPIEI